MAYTTIDKPTDYFNTKLYTGTGSSHAVSGIGFQPDWVWIKCRDDTHNHQVFDSVRGVHKRMRTDTNGAETTSSESLKSFDSDGFTLGTQSNVNASASGDNSFVAWNWLAGTSFTNDASSTGIGSIDSAGSVNTDAGFSIVSYTGTGSNATVGHGLGVTPKMIIVKDRSAAKNWTVYHIGVGNDKDILLDVTNAENTSTAWNNTTPSSSVFSIGTLGNVNTSSNNYIAYCFAEKKGFSKFGSYTGNGQSEDGPFIYTGFKPAFVIVKKYDSTGGNWVMWDNKRSDVPNANVNDQVLYPNEPNAELSSATREIDTLSNGFKIRGEGGNINADADNFIYMAFAENPLVGTNNIPATAR